VLVGYKGILKNVLKQEGEYIPTVFYEQRTTHSTKPVTMYEYIEKRTIGRRIELFARSTRGAGRRGAMNFKRRPAEVKKCLSLSRILRIEGEK
jgi:N6-adenosine-specific RNA methylase IME4